MFSLCNTFSGLNSRTLQRATYFSFNHQRRKHLDRAGGGTKNTGVPFPFKATKEVKEVRIPVPWGHIAGKLWGPPDNQPLLCIHGWQDNASTWDLLAPLFPPTTTLLCIDLPGHGRSSHYPPGCSYYFIEYLKSVRRVVAHYGIRRATLIGHSLGSILSFVYSCVYPLEVHRLIGIDAMKPFSKDPTACLNRGGKMMDNAIAVDNYTKQTAPHYTREEALTRMLTAASGWLTRSSAEVLLDRGLSEETHSDGKFTYSRDVRVKYLEKNFLSNDDTLVHLSRGCRCHVMAIRASEGIKYDTKRQHNDVQKALESAAASFTRHDVKGTHHVHLNDPQLVYKLVADFIEKTKE